MNRDEAKQLLPVIQAYSEGKAIQMRIGNDWYAVENDCAIFGPPDRYRIKPEPIECWAVVYDDGSFRLGFTNKALAVEYATSGSRVLRMREVLSV